MLIQLPVAVGADGLLHRHNKPTVQACGRVGSSQRGAAGQTARLAHRIRCPAVITGQACQPFR